MIRSRWILGMVALASFATVAGGAPGVPVTSTSKGADLRARYAQARSWEQRRELLEQLVANDEPETTDFLLPFLDRPEPPYGEVHGTWALEREAAYAHLWRTGRTTTAGLCPAGPPRKVPELAARTRDGAIGTPRPIHLLSFARAGVWMEICQARRDSDGDGEIRSQWHHMGYSTGDEMDAYLVPGSGPGWRIDRLVAEDPAGRFVAVRQGTCLHLVDLRATTTLVLPGADLRAVEEGPFYPRVAFAPDGRRLAYLRGGSSPRIVVRELESGRETTLDPGVGFVRNLVFDASGGSVLIEGVPGPFSVRQPVANISTDCRGAGSCIVVNFQGPLVRRLIPLAGGPPREVADIDHAPPIAPALGPPTVRGPQGYDFPEGIWATRADGAHLRVPGGSREPRYDELVPLGPLYWKR